MTATYAKARGKHGLKETSTEKYSQTLKKKFTALMGAPKWAELGRKGVDSDDSDDEFFRVCKFMFIKIVVLPQHVLLLAGDDRHDGARKDEAARQRIHRLSQAQGPQ